MALDESDQFTDVLQIADLGCAKTKPESFLDLHHQGDVDQRIPTIHIGSGGGRLKLEFVVIEHFAEDLLNGLQGLTHNRRLQRAIGGFLPRELHFRGKGTPAS